MHSHPFDELKEITGYYPYRIALAGGWIDQPFVSRFNPTPPGSMVVVSLEPQYWFMEKAGLGSSTRKAAERLWGKTLPNLSPEQLVKDLYHAENQGRAEPSGSQDMIGMIYPGINRLDYDFDHEDGIFPRHIESCLDSQCAGWLEQVVHVLPVSQRPSGYNPLGIKNLDTEWVSRLGQSGKDCYSAIIRMDSIDLGKSLNDCMACWEAILPQTVVHPMIDIDLKKILGFYQSHYPGAMYSGCGGGYLFVIAEETIPGSFGIKVRLE